MQISRKDYLFFVIYLATIIAILIILFVLNQLHVSMIPINGELSLTSVSFISQKHQKITSNLYSKNINILKAGKIYIPANQTTKEIWLDEQQLQLDTRQTNNSIAIPSIYMDACNSVNLSSPRNNENSIVLILDFNSTCSLVDSSKKDAISQHNLLNKPDISFKTFGQINLRRQSKTKQLNITSIETIDVWSSKSATTLEIELEAQNGHLLLFDEDVEVVLKEFAITKPEYSNDKLLGLKKFSSIKKGMISFENTTIRQKKISPGAKVRFHGGKITIQSLKIQNGIFVMQFRGQVSSIHVDKSNILPSYLIYIYDQYMSNLILIILLTILPTLWGLFKWIESYRTPESTK